jgi:hypothetical protein
MYRAQNPSFNVALILHVLSTTLNLHVVSSCFVWKRLPIVTLEAGITMQTTKSLIYGPEPSDVMCLSNECGLHVARHITPHCKTCMRFCIVYASLHWFTNNKFAMSLFICSILLVTLLATRLIQEHNIQCHELA